MTSQPRFQDTGKGSFFGDFVYDQLIPRDHFLVALEKLFDWEALTRQLIRLYKGRGLVARAPYPPVLVFKMLFLSYLLGVSERQMQEMAQAACAQRYRVEQPFGLLKQKHGFGRCRYLGLARYRIQALLSFLVGNLKRMVELLTGLTFRPLAKGRRAEPLRPVYACLPWA